MVGHGESRPGTLQGKLSSSRATPLRPFSLIGCNASDHNTEQGEHDVCQHGPHDQDERREQKSSHHRSQHPFEDYCDHSPEPDFHICQHDVASSLHAQSAHRNGRGVGFLSHNWIRGRSRTTRRGPARCTLAPRPL